MNSFLGNDGESLKNDIIKDDIEISDEEWQTSESKTCNKISINNSLSILASAYDSNDDETDMELPPDENKENNGINCEEDDVDNCLPDEVKTVVVKDLPVEENDAKTYSNKNTKSSKKSKMSNIKKPLNKSNPVQRRNLTLLEKLLKNETILLLLLLNYHHYRSSSKFFRWGKGRGRGGECEVRDQGEGQGESVLN